MPVQQQIKLGCDLCQWPSKVFDSEQSAKAQGWMRITVESFYTDRDFSDRWVCPSCVRQVIEQSEKPK